MNIKTNFVCFKYVLFAAKQKRVLLWARVILWALEEYTKLKFLHLGSKYLEKRSPLPHLIKDWGFWVLDLC